MITRYITKEGRWVWGCRITGDNIHDVAEWCGGYVVGDPKHDYYRACLYFPEGIFGANAQAEIGRNIIVDSRGVFRSVSDFFVRKHFTQVGRESHYG